jgi:hypothetical protein
MIDAERDQEQITPVQSEIDNRASAVGTQCTRWDQILGSMCCPVQEEGLRLGGGSAHFVHRDLTIELFINVSASLVPI